MGITDLPAGETRRLAAGEALFRTGDPSVGLVLIRRGALELRRISEDGRIAVLHRAGAGETFAEASPFEPRHHCDGVATVASEVTLHAATQLRGAALGWDLAAHLARLLVAERARAARLALPRAEDRILDLLAGLPPDENGLRRPGRSWKAVAAELGLSHEATYRALARLERTGRIRRAAGGVALR